ncbi:hypothetical protein LEP1GSC037_0685 [Leptospira interrogans str. 2006001854]|uniref:Uncharacterized protein n=1 Tax=Leptospira interrogans str. 2006001854 TaxID=1001590 RepID=M6GT04_LEPIR|nr:hypothetical protein LEP1GSC037_0685 [Leptospira interrogans str. 2006001854]
MPGTLPYYIYVKSGRPRSEDWHYEKRTRTYIFLEHKTLPMMF